MSELIITRGISGSGKSTWAKAWVAQDSIHRAEVNRDSIRMMMHGGHVVNSDLTLSKQTEAMVTVASQQTVKELLKRGTSVVVSDTNLPQRTARYWAKMARFAGAEFRVVDLTSVPFEVCIERNAQREGADYVLEHVLRRQWDRFVAPLKGKPMPLPTMDEDSATPEPYRRQPGLPKCVLVDIDGTVAKNNGTRSPYDWDRVDEDVTIDDVIEIVEALAIAGILPVFLSGRMATPSCANKTRRWLDLTIPVTFVGPFMRADGDTRKDSIVKRELFDKHIRGVYDVVGVLDDRNQVVSMWRDELGLTCLQTAPGDF